MKSGRESTAPCGSSPIDAPGPGQVSVCAAGPAAAPAHGLVSWVRDLFSSPGLHLPADVPGRAVLDGPTGLVAGAASSADVKARLRQYEERLLHLHHLASKQAADISELRSAAEGLQKRQAADTAHPARATPADLSSTAAALAPPDPTTRRYPSTTPDTTPPDKTIAEQSVGPGAGGTLAVPAGAPAGEGVGVVAVGAGPVAAAGAGLACSVAAEPAAGSLDPSREPASIYSSGYEPDVQRLFREAVGQAVGEQRTALADSHAEVLQLLRVLREQHAAAADQAANQWREAVREAGEVHARERAQLQAQVAALVEREEELKRKQEGEKEQELTVQLRLAEEQRGRRRREEEKEDRRAAVDVGAAPDGRGVGGKAVGAHAILPGDETPGADGTLATASDAISHNLGRLRHNLGRLRSDLGNLRCEARLGEGVFAEMGARLAAAVAGAEESMRARLWREMQAEQQLFVARERALLLAQQQELLAAGERRAAAAEEAHRVEVRALRSARREAVNRLQEAQGSIRVLCRSRPLSTAERAAGEMQALQPGAEHNTIAFTQAVASERSTASDARDMTPSGSFRFDSVFGPGATEAELFLEVSPAISSVVLGQFVCVMAYGQTGAGKTFTMYGCGGGGGRDGHDGRGSGEGSGSVGSAAGLIRLAAAQLLDESAAEAAERSGRGTPVTFSLGASLLEIYNDRVRDLLAGVAATGEGEGPWVEEQAFGVPSKAAPRESAPSRAPARADGRAPNPGLSSLPPPGVEARDRAPDRDQGWGSPPPPGVEVRVSSDGSVTVPGLTVVPFSDAAAVARLIEAGVRRRVTHATRCNENSSRSHLVLTLHCEMRDDRNGSTVHGRCHLVDLAGSERIAISGVEGDRLRESNHINKSLSALEQVFVALQTRGKDNSAHVPYRNSKLTMLLSDALGAKGACAKTIMLMQVSPAASSACESLRTLRFGERCQAVEMGAIRRGGRRAAEPPTGDDRVRALQLELSEARSQTKQAEARAMASEARAAAAAAGRQAAPLPVSPLAATLGSATLAQTSQCLSAAQRQQLGLALAQADLGDENRTPNQADLGGENRTPSGSPARAGRPLSSRPLWAPPQPYQLRHSRSARLPTRAAVVERAAQGGGPADTPRGAVSVPPLERPGSRRGTMLGPRDVSSARQRALLYEAGRFRTFL